MSRDIEDMQMQTFAAASALAASGRLLPVRFKEMRTV